MTTSASAVLKTPCMYLSKGSLTQYRKYCESKSKGEPCWEFAIKSQTVVLWCSPGHIQDIEDNPLSTLKTPMCSVHTRGGTREHAWVHKIFTLCALRSVWYLMLMLSKHYVDPAKSPADKAAGAQWADHRGRILSIQGFAGSPSHWSVFFYLLSVCFLSTSGQSLSEFLSIQGFARSPSQ